MAWRIGTPSRMSILTTTFPRATPLFPVTHPNATPKPAIESIKQLQLRRQAVVAHPAANVTSQQRQAMLHRDASAAAGDLADTMLEALNGLRGHVNGRSRFTERES